MSTMSDKEKKVQVALGTLNIPELIPINLNKVDKNNNHPDINKDEWYLVLICGEYKIGYIDLDDDEFCIDAYDQIIVECEAIWLIKGRSS